MSPLGVTSVSCPLCPRGSPSARQCRRLRHPSTGKGWQLSMPVCFYHLEIVSNSATNRIFVFSPLCLTPCISSAPLAL